MDSSGAISVVNHDLKKKKKKSQYALQTWWHNKNFQLPFEIGYYYYKQGVVRTRIGNIL